MSPARSTRSTWLGVGAGVAVLAVTMGAAWAATGSSSPAAAPIVQVRTAADLVKTYASAAPGTTIELATGVYQPKQLKRAIGAPPLTQAVVLRAATGATVEVRNLDVNGPALRVDDLHLTGNVRFRARAVGGAVLDSTVQPGTIIVEADRVAIERNTIRGPDDRDGLDIGATDGKGPYGVMVRGNTIGPGRLTPGSTAHVDCLQVMSADNLTVEDNILFDCPAQTMLVKSDLGPIRGVTILRNSLRGCLPPSSGCPGLMTLQIVPGAHPMRTITVTGNSVAGALRAVDAIPGVTFTGNAIDHVEDGCQYPMVGNVIGTSRCTIPPGNTQAQPLWLGADRRPPDLRPAPGSPVQDAGTATLGTDADGRRSACGARWDAGAYERC